MTRCSFIDFEFIIYRFVQVRKVCSAGSFPSPADRMGHLEYVDNGLKPIVQGNDHAFLLSPKLAFDKSQKRDTIFVIIGAIDDIHVRSLLLYVL